MTRRDRMVELQVARWIIAERRQSKPRNEERGAS